MISKLFRLGASLIKKHGKAGFYTKSGKKVSPYLRREGDTVKSSKETRKKLKEYKQKLEKQYKRPETRERHLNELKRRLRTRDGTIARRKKEKRKQIDDSFKRAEETSTGTNPRKKKMIGESFRRAIESSKKKK